MISRITKFFTNEWIIINAIMVNSVLLFLMGYDNFHNDPYISILDHGFTLFFVLEMSVKIGLYGWRNYIKDGWNKFDFILVAISIPSLFELFITIPDVSFLLVFRLLRVLRILRFMRFIPNITKMFSGIARAIRTSAFIFAVLIIYNVLIAVLSSYLFKKDAPEYFGNPSIALYSIFQVFTLEGWNEIPSAVIEGIESRRAEELLGEATETASIDPATESMSQPPAAGASGKSVFTRFFFFFVVLTGGIFGMSIMNAIFVDEMTMDNNDHLEEKIDDLNEKVAQLMAKLDEKSDA